MELIGADKSAKNRRLSESVYNTVKFETGWNLPPLLNIGVGTGGAGGPGPPQYLPSRLY